ncbi:MAG: hypothetical protein WHT46_04460 [Candidatus Geothermincolales bacterium]
MESARVKRSMLAIGILALLLASSLGGVMIARIFFPGEARAYGSKGVGALRWYFAEGYTGPGFEEWILIFNPPKEIGGSGRVAMVRLGYYGNNGLLTHSYVQLEPGCRATVNVNEELSKVNYKGDVSIVVLSTENNAPIICERAMYYNYKGIITGGSQVLGYQEAELD